MDDMGDEIDVVVVGMFDYMYYVVIVDVMCVGKYVYVQKLLIYLVYEFCMLVKLVKEIGVVIQMGNQGNFGEGICQVCEWIWNGEIGEVKEVYVWINCLIWLQGLEWLIEMFFVLFILDWDFFIGLVKWCFYYLVYMLWNWCVWWDFGIGVLGDMGCYIIDLVFKVLNFGQFIVFEGSFLQVNMESVLIVEKVMYYFFECKKMGKVNMLVVEFIWYDGGLLFD